jgi:hypothetical protein
MRGALACATATWVTGCSSSTIWCARARVLDARGARPDRVGSAEVLPRLEQQNIGDRLPRRGRPGGPWPLRRARAPGAGRGPHTMMASDAELRGARPRRRRYQCADRPAGFASSRGATGRGHAQPGVRAGQIGGGSRCSGAPRSIRPACAGRRSVARRAEAERTPVLLDELARLDPHILGTTLGLRCPPARRQRDALHLVAIQDPEFETRGETCSARCSARSRKSRTTTSSGRREDLHEWRLARRRSYTQLAAALTLRQSTPRGATRARNRAQVPQQHRAQRGLDALRSKVT